MIKEVTEHHSTKAWPSERPSLAQSAVLKVLAVRGILIKKWPTLPCDNKVF
jgi:hypothetical protein